MRIKLVTVGYASVRGASLCIVYVAISLMNSIHGKFKRCDDIKLNCSKWRVFYR